MAFVTTVESSSQTSKSYNVDFSVGTGAKGNFPDDIMLVQALMRIIFYELPEGVRLRAPGQDRGIVVDGLLGPSTVRHLIQFESILIGAGEKDIRPDHIYDPFRSRGEHSHLTQSRYKLELLNNMCFSGCRARGLDAYDSLPDRTDLPPRLQAALNLPARGTAQKYQR